MSETDSPQSPGLGNAQAEADGTSAIGVFIICNVRIYRDGLAEMLARMGLRVLGSAPECRGAIEKLRTTSPDVILLDAATGGAEGNVRRLAKELPASKILAIGVSELEHEMICLAEAGALGYIPHSASGDEAVDAVRGAARGEAVCSPRIVAALFRHVGALAAERVPEASQPHLTARELEVLALIDRGLSNKEIASFLSIGVATVKNHVHSILQKLNLRRRAEAIAWLRDRNGAGLPR